MSELPSEARSGGTSWTLIALGLASAVAGLVLIGSAVAMLARSDTVALAEAQRRLEDAGCTVTRHPAKSAFHLEKLDRAVKYNSFPPSNGDHYRWPALWGSYLEPVDQRRLVHNLEHGGIAIQYGELVPYDTVGQLEVFYFEDRNAVVLAPLPRLGDRIALTAWVVDPEGIFRERRFGAGYVALCTRFDEDSFGDFRTAFRYRGRESYRFPREVLGPGV